MPLQLVWPTGPLLQCVVWHDGTHWRAAVDTSDMHEPGSGKGLLADFKPLTNYKAERQFGTFSAQDGCNFVCNIYEEGDVLSIVVDSGSHGTHVAGITAAHQPGNPSLNGIAPGMRCGCHVTCCVTHIHYGLDALQHAQTSHSTLPIAKSDVTTRE